MALFAKHIPQLGGAGLGRGQRQAAFLQCGSQFGGKIAGLADAGEVAFDVGQKHGHADAGKLLGQLLQGHCFACARGTGDQAVAVGQARQEVAGGLCTLGEQHGFGHGRFPRGFVRQK